ncbi:MAG: GNAT family N-acetyltransferase [archaeon]
MEEKLEILQLSKEFCEKISNKILKLEKNWVEIGDEAWNIDNLMYELPLKWEVSHVALIGDEVVGYQIGSLRDNSVFLNKIIVDASKRGLGIGKKLLKAFLEKASKNNIKNVIFRVRTDNPAVTFYDKLEFNKVEGVDKTRSDGIDSYFYDTEISKVIDNLR